MKLPPRRLDAGAEGVRGNLEALGVFLRLLDVGNAIPPALVAAQARMLRRIHNTEGGAGAPTRSRLP